MDFCTRGLLCLGGLLWLVSGAMANAVDQPVPATTTASATKSAGKMITLSDFGAEDLAYLALPQQAPVGGVVIVHDRWGLDDNTKRLVEHFAVMGYVTLAVDLYNGRIVNDVGQANVLVANIRLESAMNTIRAGVRLLKESPRLKVPRSAVIGYSSGATLALLASQQIPDIDAVVAVNGVIAPRDKKISKYKVPICLVFPRMKEEEVPAGLPEFEKLMADLKNPLDIQYIQPAPDGFADPHSANYSADIAEKAWEIADKFLRPELSKPAKPPTLLDRVEGFFK